MARTIAQIVSYLKTVITQKAAAIGITITPTLWSKTDYKSLMLETIAVESAIQEQIYDTYVTQAEEQISKASPMTSPWLRDKMINLFEYNATTVPVIKLQTTELYPYYPIPVAQNRIITFCSVNIGLLGTTLIKCAKGTTPTALSAPELYAAQSFINIITFNGINYNVVSYDSDKLYIDAEVFYTGIYASVISDTTIAAITLFLASIPFNGTVELGSLLGAIRSVPGVTRVVFNNIQARADTTAYGSGTNMVSSKAWVSDIWNTFSGYIVPETTTGHELTDSLTFTAE